MPRPYGALVVDDVAQHRTLLCIDLEDSGLFTVLDFASDGNEAIAKAAACKPDIILLDVSMPERDGLDALPEIKAVSPESKVVMLTSQEGDDMMAAAIDAGAEAYLIKGISAETLIDALQQIMAEDAAADEGDQRPSSS